MFDFVQIFLSDVTCVFFAGGTVRGYTVHSRCSQHGSKTKVRLMFPDILIPYNSLTK